MRSSDSVCDCDEFVFCDPLPPPSVSNLTLTNWINDAAQEVLQRIASRNDGALPKTLDQWILSCNSFDISVRSLRRGSTFTAVLVGMRGGSWWIFYNSMASIQRQILFIAHELAEYITRVETWQQSAIASCSDFSEDQIRHMVAKAVEESIERVT